ncbi:MULTISPECIES: PTS sugar transporter subunit IIA [Enterococcus]|uniref:PTS EIIA type-4 domain-containing protein n=1 Tax=Enterococcus alishanensis TaxID=1303817 RepID=A0ABS6TFG6_9ENTE|nr:hypothetical protein [Enterococcus alishanensis]MBV7391649.1 hypothetical protein [Enterococcus alishanensis]
MTKFAIATHGNFAKGLESTLELFVPNQDITFLSAYVEDLPPIEQQLEDFFANLDNEELVVVFTDLFGGSVNQKVLLGSEGKNIQIIAGFNLPIVLEIILNQEDLTTEKIQQLIEASREALQIVPPINQIEENEEEFFA